MWGVLSNALFQGQHLSKYFLELIQGAISGQNTCIEDKKYSRSLTARSREGNRRGNKFQRILMEPYGLPQIPNIFLQWAWKVDKTENSCSLKDQGAAGSFPITQEVETGSKSILARAVVKLWQNGSPAGKTTEGKKRSYFICCAGYHLNKEWNLYSIHCNCSTVAKSGWLGHSKNADSQQTPPKDQGAWARGGF